MSVKEQGNNIIRVVKNKENPYVQINKTCLNDPRLSLKAMGLLCFMLSKPDNWVFRRNEMLKHFRDGKDSLASGLKELARLGYVKIVRERGPDGRTTQWNTLVFESPQLANTLDYEISPEPDFPDLVNPPLLKNDLTNTDPLQGGRSISLSSSSPPSEDRTTTKHKKVNRSLPCKFKKLKEKKVISPQPLTTLEGSPGWVLETNHRSLHESA